MYTAAQCFQMPSRRQIFGLFSVLPALVSAQPPMEPQPEPFAIESFEAPFVPVEELEGAPFDEPLAVSTLAEPQPLTVSKVTALNLYAASVPVRSRGLDDRAEALQAAFSKVLTRLSGDAAAVANAPDLIRRAPQLVQQYRYETPPPASDGVGPRSQQLTLLAEFSPSVVAQEIRLAGLPQWEGPRPTTLLWPLVQTTEGWQLLASDSLQVSRWQSLADARGVALLLATGDFPLELRKLPVAAIDEQLRILGEGLVADPHEPVRIILSGEEPQRWRQLASLQQSWLARDEQAGFATLIDGYAQRSTVVAQSGPTVALNVANIRSLADYAAVQRYFQKLQQVQSQQLQAAEADSVTFSLQLQGDAELLRSALALDGKLQPTSQQLAYRWVAN